MNRWALQDAKSRLSELVKSAATDGPQEITVRGKPAVVVLSTATYERLKGRKPRFVDFVRNSPLMDSAIDLTRDRSPVREVDL